MPKKYKVSAIGVITAAFLTVPVGAGAAPLTSSGPAPSTAKSALTGQAIAECAGTADAEQGDTFDMTLIDGAPAEQLTAEVTALVDGGDVALQAPAETLVHDDAKAYRIEAGSGQQPVTSVSVPIAGDYSAPLSNLTVLFDADGTLIQYAETLYSQADSGNFHISSYVDGALTINEDTGIAYLDDEELQSEVAAAADAVAESKNTGACIAAVLGVSGAVGAAIAYACVGSCSVPMTPVTGPVCAACVAGFAVIGGASITAIASCF